MGGNRGGQGEQDDDPGGAEGDGITDAGNLVIGRGRGQGIYIGPEIRLTVVRIAANGITLRVEGPARVAVTDGDVDLEEHMKRVQRAEAMPKAAERVGDDYTLLVGTGLYVGRGVEVTLVALRDQRAQIAIEAPQWMAVSRDAMTFERHMEFQLKRERA